MTRNEGGILDHALYLFVFTFIFNILLYSILLYFSTWEDKKTSARSLRNLLSFVQDIK